MEEEIQKEIQKLKEEIENLKKPKPEGFKDLVYFPIMKTDKSDIALNLIQTTTDMSGREGQISIVKETDRFTFFSGGSWQ